MPLLRISQQVIHGRARRIIEPRYMSNLLTGKHMLSQQSVTNLRKVKQFILKEPRRFNMQAGVEPSRLISDQLEQPPCGTACCIAGAAYIIKNEIKLTGRKHGLHVFLPTVIMEGQLFLELTYDQKETLFYPWHWPQPYMKLYEKAETAQERAAVGALMIEHFIAAGGQV